LPVFSAASLLTGPRMKCSSICCKSSVVDDFNTDLDLCAKHAQ